MIKKQIKKLAELSYTKETLDSKKVNKIVKYLKTDELKEYIKAIKIIENNKKVVLIVPEISGKESIIKEMKKLFPGKKIIVKTDKSIIAGIRIIDNDNIYDFNLKDTLNNLVTYINE